MAITPVQHTLRLTTARDCEGTDDLRPLRFPRDLVAPCKRDQSAPILASPQWAVAVRAWTLLQGTMLTPQRRRDVLDLAKLLRVRPFEANLIIALVQDHARRNGTLAELNETVMAIPVAQKKPDTTTPRGSAAAVRMIVAGTAAVAFFMLLARWLNGG